MEWPSHCHSFLNKTFLSLKQRSIIFLPSMLTTSVRRSGTPGKEKVATRGGSWEGVWKSSIAEAIELRSIKWTSEMTYQFFRRWYMSVWSKHTICLVFSGIFQTKTNGTWKGLREKGVGSGQCGFYRKRPPISICQQCGYFIRPFLSSRAKRANGKLRGNALLP